MSSAVFFNKKTLEVKCSRHIYKRRELDSGEGAGDEVGRSLTGSRGTKTRARRGPGAGRRHSHPRANPSSSRPRFHRTSPSFLGKFSPVCTNAAAAPAAGKSVFTFLALCAAPRQPRGD
ncbi:hypothetical protein EVAR_92123_1 [Eumeta japonica]|uniref:Uncharacterized protein n=1 Tax=Eumeta variegata TaxID=151549 RepID=A0A4C1SYH0_EUMVA|nr:hypothetical protein EVAR_92123_1 [Eumeta japonica]